MFNAIVEFLKKITHQSGIYDVDDTLKELEKQNVELKQGNTDALIAEEVLEKGPQEQAVLTHLKANNNHSAEYLTSEGFVEFYNDNGSLIIRTISKKNDQNSVVKGDARKTILNNFYKEIVEFDDELK